MNGMLSCVLAALCLVWASAGTAVAGLCPKCKGRMYTADVGKCKACGGFTSSGAFKLCKKCSAKLKQCEHCRAPLKEQAGLEDIVLDEKANGKTVAATIGQQILIRLKGNPTTGYRWDVAKLEGEAIEQVGKAKYAVDKGAEGRMGAGGTFVFTFKAVRKGKATLTLAYARPWEKKKKPAKTFRLTVEVKPLGKAKK